MFDHNAMKASQQWSTRPDEERFTSLNDMHAHFVDLRNRSDEVQTSTRKIKAEPGDDPINELVIRSLGADVTAAPTHHAFGQLATKGKAPAGYLRTLPAPIAADCMNYGLHHATRADDVQLLLTQVDDGLQMRAATGPNYGRIWNYEVTDQLIQNFGDGATGRWKVPGEFGKAVTVDKGNTTLYGSDRDMFVFLADESDAGQIEISNRRDGQAGQLNRGFFLWNSEVGDKSIGMGVFLFDFVCMNRIVWGMQDYTEKRFRHTSSAPDRWAEEMLPILREFANSDMKPVAETLAAAQASKVERLDAFLANRWSKNLVTQMHDQHEREEGKPISTYWDVVTAATAVAREMPHQHDRVQLEREAGKVLDLIKV